MVQWEIIQGPASSNANPAPSTASAGIHEQRATPIKMEATKVNKGSKCQVGQISVK